MADDTTFLQKAKSPKGLAISGGGGIAAAVLTAIVIPKWNAVSDSVIVIQSLKERVEKLEQINQRQWESLREVRQALNLRSSATNTNEP